MSVSLVADKTLNETKTKLKEARGESFDFLGYTFGPQHYRKDGHWYLGAAPSKKSVARLRQNVNEVLVPSSTGTWPEVRDRLNQILQGWSNYFSYGTRLLAYRAVDNHVAARIRHFLRRRHKVSSRGTRTLADNVIFVSSVCCVCVACIWAPVCEPDGESSRRAGGGQSARPVR